MIKREKIQEHFGVVVRKERKLQRLTQSELAERSDLDNTYISQIERGLANPSIYTLYKIADSLGLSETEFFQKMTTEITIDTPSTLKPTDELEIIYDAIVRLNAGLLLTTTEDDDFRVIYCNDAFLELSKFKREEIIGKKLIHILADGKNDDVLFEYLSQLRKDKTRREYITSSNINGKPLPLEINTTPVTGNKKQAEKHLFILKQKFYRVLPDQETDDTVEKYKLMLSETNHRIKNNLSIIAGIIDVNIMGTEEGNVKKILKDTQLRISSIAHIHDLLTKSADHSKLGIRDYLDKLTTVIRNIYDFKNEVTLETTIEVEDLGIDEVISLGLLSNELITNSYKHAFNGQNDGKILLNLYQNIEGGLSFSYEDNGTGFDEEKFKKRETLGINLIHTFMEQLQAEDMQIDTSSGFKLDFKMNGLEYTKLSRKHA